MKGGGSCIRAWPHNAHAADEPVCCCCYCCCCCGGGGCGFGRWRRPADGKWCCAVLGLIGTRSTVGGTGNGVLAGWLAGWLTGLVWSGRRGRTESAAAAQRRTAFIIIINSWHWQMAEAAEACLSTTRDECRSTRPRLALCGGSQLESTPSAS